ncbi:MAG: ParB N-terminal domain-containing protein [Pseudomonadota bacterium]
MKLEHIELNQLKPSLINVRKNGDTSGQDLIPSLKALGVIQPLLVRPNCEGFEVIAGQRRLNALQAIAKTEAVDAVPCIIMEDGDDAKAIEASLTENIARLPMDELNQYEAFAALKTRGRSVSDIAAHFGVTERLVNQRLVLANLHTPIRNAYRKEEIDGEILRLLTLASKRQQQDWYKLFKEGNEPPTWKLKSWLFGGEEIPTSHALFDLDDYKGAITSNLFGEDSYFADPDLFWEHQSQAIAALIEELEDDGWRDIILLDVGERWSRWDHVDTPKDKGGKVYIEVCSDGEVKAHKGLLSEKEAKRLALVEAGEKAPKPERPELTISTQNYLDLHRHAAVRTQLLKHPQTALRLCAAQIIAGSSLWDVRADKQKANTDAIKASLETNTAQAAFAEAKAQILELLEIKNDPDRPLVCHIPHYGRGLNAHAVFAKLMTLKDEEVMEIIAYLAAETLPSGRGMVEGLGVMLDVDMAACWKPDEVFFDLLRDKEAINAMLADIGGKTVAKGNLTQTAKVQKSIIQDFLSGAGREKVENWMPRYMAFPMTAYTKRGGVSAIEAFKAVKKHYSV